MTKIFIKTYMCDEKNIIRFECEYPLSTSTDDEVFSFFNKQLNLNSKNIQLPFNKMKKNNLDFFNTHINNVFIISTKMKFFLEKYQVKASYYPCKNGLYHFCLFSFKNILDIKKSHFECDNHTMLFPIFNEINHFIGHDINIGSQTLLISTDLIDKMIAENFHFDHFYYPISFRNEQEVIFPLFTKYDKQNIWSDLSDYLKKHQLPESLNPYS